MLNMKFSVDTRANGGNIKFFYNPLDIFVAKEKWSSTTKPNLGFHLTFY